MTTLMTPENVLAHLIYQSLFAVFTAKMSIPFFSYHVNKVSSTLWICRLPSHVWKKRLGSHDQWGYMW